jgi:hypothetical protein
MYGRGWIMAYRVVYGSLGEEKRSAEPKRRRFAFGALALVLTMVLVATLIHIGALPWVQEVLLPGDSVVTAAALENMVGSIMDGVSLADAVTAFCREILAHASA